MNFIGFFPTLLNFCLWISIDRFRVSLVVWWPRIIVKMNFVYTAPRIWTFAGWIRFLRSYILTVKFGKGKRKDRFFVDFSKGLLFHCNTSNLKVVRGKESRHGSWSILDFELGAILWVAARFFAVIFVVKNCRRQKNISWIAPYKLLLVKKGIFSDWLTASNIGDRASLARNL